MYVEVARRYGNALDEENWEEARELLDPDVEIIRPSGRRYEGADRWIGMLAASGELREHRIDDRGPRVRAAKRRGGRAQGDRPPLARRTGRSPTRSRERDEDRLPRGPHRQPALDRGASRAVKVALAFDHRGVKLRERVFDEVVQLGHEPVDLGTDRPEPKIDYPDKAREVGDAIREGRAERAVLICGSGVGASVAACKIAGIRAAICHDVYSAHQGVEHDDMNVLCLGSEVVGAELAAELVRVFLAAEFDGGERYVRRLEKIEEMEKAHG